VKDREARYMKAVVRSEMKCEPSVVYIHWMVLTNSRKGCNSFRFNQVLHRLLTLLLHECEPMLLVTLRYCCLQEDKTDQCK
jgi:hypothetical protein